ncbi:MAG: hypothetical protein ACE5IO_00690 [Thermoplasmata archaeon]
MTMRWRRFGLVLLRIAVLFALSAVLVGGFWFHAEFYKLGLPLLVSAGAVTVILTVLGFKFAISGEFQSLGRPKKTLEFGLDEIEKVRHGVKKSVLKKPREKRDVRLGSIVSAKLKGDDTEIFRLRILGIDRKHLADFDKGDLEVLGIASKGELSEIWRELGGKLDDGEFGELVYFERVEAERRG